MSHELRRLCIGLSLFVAATAYGAPCSGNGTVIFYGNGMFNTVKDAEASLKDVQGMLKNSNFSTGGRELKVQLAYKRDEPLIEQLLTVTLQKGVTELERFWAWLYSIEKRPEWFQEALKSKLLSSFQRMGASRFYELSEHLESYSSFIRDGYNVILISHSQGNFYANQVMRKLSVYTDSSLTGSLDKKAVQNSFYPKFRELFSNVQVATPVSATVDSSPWTTFKDDWVIQLVRGSLGALPGNIQSLGMGLPPEGDPLGHSFTKAYLRVGESRSKLMADLTNAYQRLRHPFAYFQPAVQIEHTAPLDPKRTMMLSFDFHDPQGEEYPGGHREEWPSKDLQILKEFVGCFDLKRGKSMISAETIVDGSKNHEFQYTVWPEGGLDLKKEVPVNVKFTANAGIHRWRIGTIQTQQGVGKEPLEVKVEIYPRPLLIR